MTSGQGVGGVFLQSLLTPCAHSPPRNAAPRPAPTPVASQPHPLLELLDTGGSKINKADVLARLTAEGMDSLWALKAPDRPPLDRYIALPVPRRMVVEQLDRTPLPNLPARSDLSAFLVAQLNIRDAATKTVGVRGTAFSTFHLPFHNVHASNL
jgi:hypothetical protein